MSAEPAEAVADGGAVPGQGAFGSDYRGAMTRHVRSPDEATLRQAYELGRAVIALDIGVLDIAAAHHEGLCELLRSRPPDRVDETLARAADFLSEALTAYEMVRRSFLALRETERQQRHHASVVRGLSDLLADTSLAAHGRESVAEMLQLVVEHARELTNAARCAVELTSASWLGRLHAVVDDGGGAPLAREPDLQVELTSLDGAPLGRIALWSSAAPFSELDQALVVHLAQMASAAVDRAALFRGGAA